MSFSIGKDPKPQACRLGSGQTPCNTVWASPASAASASKLLEDSAWLQILDYPTSKRPKGGAPLSTRPSGGFTLVEILVTMTLLAFIVLGLLMMFNQTQRAFRAGLAYTDVLEGGRNAMDLLVRDLEQMTPCEGANRGTIPMYNFWTSLDAKYPNPDRQYVAPGIPQRTNIVQQFFFLSKYNQDWTANYYRVEPDNVDGSAVGSLYRYSLTCPRYLPLSQGWSLYNSRPTPPASALSAFSTNRIVDGVVHLHLTAFDINGVPLTYYNNSNMGVWVNNQLRPTLANAYGSRWTFSAGTQASQMDYAFWSNAVPAYVELELGILEPKVLQHYRAIGPTTAAAANYLSNHVGQVHLFRQRIPIRNVDFTAYQ